MQIKVNMMVNLRMMKKTEGECSPIAMVIDMKEIGRMMKYKDRGC